jgi:magnesium transporter
MEAVLRSGHTYWLDMEIADIPAILPYQALLPGHPLSWEDAGKPTQRPKLEEHGDHFFLVMRGLDTARHRLAEQLHTLQLACFLTSNCLITIRSGPMASVAGVRERVEKELLRLEAGPDGLLHAILDDLVDRYGPHVEEWEAEMDRLLKEAMDRPRQLIMGHILSIRKHMLLLRRLAFNQREILTLLARERAGLIQPHWLPYFRDVLDHLTSLVEASETLRDSVSIAVDVYLNSVNNRLNEVMKVLTVISSVMLPLTLVTGIFGMNFDRIPGLHHPSAFFVVIGGMILLAVGMLIIFKRSRWL